MAKRYIIVIGTSAGGVTALQQLAAAFPADLQAAVFVVIHLPTNSPSYLPEILSKAGPLRALHPLDGQPIEQGKIYVAPPDFHLLLEADRVLVKRGPKENRFRPSIDTLFRSAAYSYGSRVIGVVLTGMLSDGTSGIWSVKRMGGTAIIQDPREAEYAGMPQSVLEYVAPDYQVNLAELAPLLCRLTQETVEENTLAGVREKRRMQMEIAIAAQQNAFEMGIQKMGDPSLLTCPECHGALLEIKEGNRARYRCHTGHGFTADSLLAEVSKTVEETLWSACRSLEEAVILLEQAAKRAFLAGRSLEGEKSLQEAGIMRLQARKMHEFIYRHSQNGNDENTHVLSNEEMH